MSSSPVTLGLVGCGRLAEAGYVPAIAAAAGVRLVAVADPDPARRDHVAALAAGRSDGNPVAAFPDTEALLAQASIDGVVLASPAATHGHDAASAAAAGVALLVEKPPAPDAAGAAELARVAPTARIGFNRRFEPGVDAVRERVPAHGDVQLDLRISYRRRSWRAHAVQDDALLDLGPHLVDWARWLSGGEVVDVACSEAGPERASLELTLSRGRARLRAATDRPHAELVEVRDAAGTVVARHRAGGPVAAVRGRLGLGAGPHRLVTSLASQLEAFAATVRHEPAPALGTVGDGVAVMAVLDAARSSAARSGRPVPADPSVESQER